LSDFYFLAAKPMSEIYSLDSAIFTAVKNEISNGEYQVSGLIDDLYVIYLIIIEGNSRYHAVDL